MILAVQTGSASNTMPRGQRARCGAFDGGSEMIALSAANDSSEISGIGASGRDLWSTATTSSVSTRMASRAAAELSTPPGLRGSLTLHGIEAMRAMHAAWNSRCVSRPARASAMRSPNIARNMASSPLVGAGSSSCSVAVISQGVALWIFAEISPLDAKIAQSLRVIARGVSAVSRLVKMRRQGAQTPLLPESKS